MPLFELQDVSKSYKGAGRRVVTALAGVSLAVESKSFVVLLGPSGSGKSTLLGILGALVVPTSGRVIFDGRRLDDCWDAERARIRRRFGFVFQDFSLIGGLRVWENVAYPLIPRGMSRRERFAKAAEVLSEMGLAERLGDRPEQLSGGEQQRVAVARALAVQPDVVLADEPTSNLDPQGALSLFAALRALNARGTTVIVSSHAPEFAQAATHTFRLHLGSLRDRDPAGS
jgi:ABC-type lipoprotein export system ATPase subunit